MGTPTPDERARWVSLAQQVTFLAMIRRNREALARIPALLAEAPDWHLAHLVHALVLAQAGRHDESLAAAETALGLAPDDAHALQVIADEQLALGRVDAAWVAITRAVALAPRRARYHASRSAIAVALGRSEDALAAIREAIAIDPEEADYFVKLIDLADWRARPEEAQRQLREALALDPSNARVFYRLAQLALERREYDECRFWIAETLRNDPTNKDAANLEKGITLTGEKIEDPGMIGEIGRAMRAAMVEVYRRRVPAGERRLTLEKLGALIAAHQRFLDELGPEQKLTWERLTFAGRSFEYFKEPGIRRLGDQLVLRDYELCELTIPEATLSFANLAFSRWQGTTFERCELATAMAVEVVAERSAFIDCDLLGVDFSDSTLTDVRFVGGRGDRLDFERCTLTGCVFEGISLAGASFIGATLVDCRFEGVELSTIHRRDATFERCVGLGLD